MYMFTGPKQGLNVKKHTNEITQLVIKKFHTFFTITAGDVHKWRNSKQMMGFSAMR